MALLLWAWCPALFLPSLHFDLWPLPLSAAPCLGKMRVSSTRWRVLGFRGGGGAAVWSAFLLVCTFLWGRDSVVGPAVREPGAAGTFLGLPHSASSWG